jgi:thiamine pyrophosphate-dependent acetolactate synthase large subunit-like protein
MTAIQEGLPIAVLILNHSARGWVLHGMESKPVAARFDESEYAEVARSRGVMGYRLMTPTSFESP